MLASPETSRVERTTSVNNTDKFCEAICAFANDIEGARESGYLIIGAEDDGKLSGLRVTDKLMKNIAAIRSDGNILPIPAMTVEKFTFTEGDVLVVEVQPSPLPPVRYKGRTYIRVGPRKAIASESEERLLSERRAAYMATFDATPCVGAKLKDIDVDYIKNKYLPKIYDEETRAGDDRAIEEILAAIHLYDNDKKCPTYAALILFGKNPKYFLPGHYIQYVSFAGADKSGEILNEREFNGALYKVLPKIESFVNDAIITQRPARDTLFKEKTVCNYPEGAIRELLMNACMHRDYQSNMPIRLYQFDDYIEIMNAGGLYGQASPENFPHVNDYRNPLIAEAMKTAKYVNKFNRGIARVQKMLAENGNRPAEFDVRTLTAFRALVFAANGNNRAEDRERSINKDARTMGGVSGNEDTSRRPDEDISRGANRGEDTSQDTSRRPDEDISRDANRGEDTSQDAREAISRNERTSENSIEETILEFCRQPRSLAEIAAYCNFKSIQKFRDKYIKKMLGASLRMTIPDKPTSRFQKYVAIGRDA